MGVIHSDNPHSYIFSYDDYIMPPIPPPALAIVESGLSSFLLAKTHSVVRNIEAIDAAFSKATRDTFVGSMIPAASISS
jgi:hypothetical protein